MGVGRNKGRDDGSYMKTSLSTFCYPTSGEKYREAARSMKKEKNKINRRIRIESVTQYDCTLWASHEPRSTHEAGQEAAKGDH